MTTAVPQPPPRGYVVFGLLVLTTILVAWFFTGCVSIKTHEIAKIESYEQGHIDMADSCIRSIEAGATKEEILIDLKNIVKGRT